MSNRPPPDPVVALRGHRASVTDVCFHPFNVAAAGEDRVISQGRDGAIKLRDLREAGLSRCPVATIITSASSPEREYSGEARWRLKGVIMLPQLGKILSVVEIWDVKTAEKLVKLLPSSVDCATKSRGMCMTVGAFLPSESEVYAHVVAGFEDGSMVLWDLRNPTLPVTIVKFHSETVLSFSVDSSCGGRVSGSADEKIVRFNLNPSTGLCMVKKETILEWHSITGTSIRQDAESKLMASSSEDATIALWELYPPRN
ncbi:protein DECREASED SIZE EXCLUSION LIMIT 1-like [Salvia divinorum]|uniref:Protein DECREASED SIZE EXCLUSION LIMIT 1-like n=1 Tax=Salvia divinorum TaxID=28513 RepID=A0ABD1FPB4_SALDI